MPLNNFQCVCSRFYQWYQWYTNIVQGSNNGTIGNTIGTNGNANGTIGSPNGTIGTIGKPMVPFATSEGPLSICSCFDCRDSCCIFIPEIINRFF